MTTVIVSPLTVDETASPTEEVIQLLILLKDEEWKGLYDRVEVWRSQDTPSGPYEELTAASWEAARMPKTGGDQPSSPVTGQSVVLVGLDLHLLSGEDEVDITFTGSDPLTYAQAAAQVSDQGSGKVTAYVDEDGAFVVRSLQAGSGARLQVLGGDAAPLLGLPLDAPANMSFGKEARIPLIEGTSSYSFNDLRGSDAFFYKVRLRNASTGAVGAFSPVYTAKYGLGVSSSHVATGRLDLVGLDGKPLQNVEVAVHNGYSHVMVEGKAIAGGQVTKLTDKNGRVEFSLVRGSKVTVAIVGTSIVRDIEVPTDTSVAVFGLLEGDVGRDDVFSVQIPDIEFAQRRSL